MRNGQWVVRTYQAGRIGEKIKYWVPGLANAKSSRRLKSEIRKQQSNESSAVKRLARAINHNFDAGDGFLCLEYRNEDLDKLQARIAVVDETERMEALRQLAQHELSLFLRRVSRACKKQGLEFKYIAITSDMDGETGESVRIHHHIVVSASVVELCRQKWGKGSVDSQKIWNEPDHYGLAKYLMDQVRRVPDAKKYTPSRNLVMPKPVDRVARGDKEVQPPRGAVILHRSEFKRGATQYVRYIVPQQREKTGGHKRGKEETDDEQL